MKLHVAPLVSRAFIPLLCILGFTLPQSRSASSYNCNTLTTHPSERVACHCQSRFGGGDADCPPGRSYQKDQHDICIGGKPAGFLVCEQSMFQVGWDSICEIRVNWSQYTICLLLAPACATACATGPNPTCLLCLATLAQCQGCNIRYCYEYPATPLWCIRPKPGHPHGECPSSN